MNVRTPKLQLLVILKDLGMRATELRFTISEYVSPSGYLVVASNEQ